MKLGATYGKEHTEAPTWEQLGLPHAVADAARQTARVLVPNELQACAIPLCLASRNVLIAAETGSGKTLAFLLPLFARLVTEECRDAAERMQFQEPRAAIVVPTDELVEQVYTVAKGLAHVAKLRIESFHTLTKRIKVDRRHEKTAKLAATRTPPASIPTIPCDIVIGTPAQVTKLKLPSLRHIVVDEADTLLVGDFCETMTRILAADGVGSVTLACATLPSDAYKAAKTLLPTMRHVISPRLHAISRRLAINIVPAERKPKIAVLKDVLARDEVPKRTMIFCNRTKTAELVHAQLVASAAHSRLGYTSASLLTGRIPFAQRRAIAARFLAGEGGQAAADYVVCTDLAARGLDTANVAHVVMFDVPARLSDFLHRAGRASRVSGRGEITCIATSVDAPAVALIKTVLSQRPTD